MAVAGVLHGGAGGVRGVAGGSVMWFSAAKPVVHRSRGVRVRTRPGWLCAENKHAPDAAHYPSLLAFIGERRPRVVGIRRSYALGDVLMLLPIARALHRQAGVEIIIVTRRDWAETFAEMSIPGLRFARDRGRGAQYPGIDVCFEMNSALEVDHRGGPESAMHRLTLYARALGYSQGCAYQEAA